MNIQTESPLDAASFFGEVDVYDYLSHSIRKIEFFIRTSLKKHYRIITFKSNDHKKSKIFFSDQCCEIRLSCGFDENQEKNVRLTLAHELGHLIFQINKLNNPELLNTTRTPEEETYAWTFAYHLIDKKSEAHKSDMGRSKFVYDSDELLKTLQAVLTERNPSVLENVIKSIKKNK